jgi:hypothetical protein
MIRIPGSCWNTTGGSNRWFKFVATTTQIKVQVKTGGSEGTIQFAYSALWESNGTTQLACVNYSSQYSDLEMSYNNLTIGNTYYVSVDNHNGSTGYRGTFTMCINDKADYDFYEAAEELTNLNNYCSANAAYTTVLATKDKNHGSCWNTVGSSNRWFKFTASATNATIQLKTGGAEGTLQYPYLALWQSNGTTQIACANYTSQYSDLTISTVVLVPGTDYYFSVDNHNGSTGYRGTFTICIDNVDQDYYSLASGDWKTIGNWSNTCHTCGASAGTPDIGDVVYIQGHAITLSSSVSVAELNLIGNDAATSLTIDNSTLTVTGITRLTSANNFDNSLVLQNSGDLTISNDLTLTRSGGANVFDITAGTGSIVSVGRDLIVVSSGGSATTNNFTFNGTSALNVTRDVLFGNTGGVKSVFTFNNTSSLNVTRDLAFAATAASKVEMIFNNTSSLNLYRHLTKSGGFGLLTFNTGTNLNLLGSVYQQNVAGTTGSGGDIFTFANITVNNTKITTPQITLTGPVSVSGTFTHTRGVIKTTSTNILNLTTSNLPSIGSSTAYIDGPLNAIVAASGATTVNLPIGKGTNYRPAVLFTNHSDASSVTYTGELVASSPSALGYTLPGSIERVSYVRYWQIDRSAVANFTSAMVRLYYNTDDGVTDFTNLTVAKNIGAGTTWNDITGTATGNNSGSILSGSFASFSKFTLANKTAGSNPLPIELISFTGEKCDEDVCLSWTTASEINNDRFEIERSANGEDFSVIASHDSKATNGTSNVNLNYNFVDSNPLEGLSYYRLNQFDFNGENEYSKIVSIESKNELENELNIFPNPSNGLFTVDCSSFSTKEIKLVITDLLGRKFIDVNISEGELNEGRYEFNLFNKLNSGVYFIEVTSGSKTIGTKLILN